jgi:nitrogen-specific signal transduction histidine kinase
MAKKPRPTTAAEEPLGPETRQALAATETEAEREAREEEDLLERVAVGLAERSLASPAMFLLEAGLPLSFVSSQALIVLEPVIQSLLSLQDYKTFVRLLENRDRVRQLVDRLEQLEEERGRKRDSDA